ncbi:hypothetical protein [Xiamenia xianingshaonis]|uniref:Uncharacterized protein n=1 Tax=Xiamenia xianingshaonis TaxID=2682776 RepID=A0A9E6MRI3_9ACTN|nr:hypothetical protein [Xiamenia xianingshaonis]NHM14452.1 hypothetical protein [Xiamenia xianingshaonis]QTU84926.1 hypothetical protein J7S26_03175 [Xiamenia xianingshaonis]
MAENVEWTTRQVEVMRDNAHLGVEGVRRALKDACGIERTRDSIKMYASRNRISLRVQTRCPACGAPNVRLNKLTGLCRRCNYERNIEQQKVYSQMLEDERRLAEEAEDLDDMRRTYDMMRQRNSRFRRKHGLQTRKRDVKT